MIHHHSSGKRGLWKRIFSMCIALVLICGVTVPASSVSASEATDGTVQVQEEQTLKNDNTQPSDVPKAGGEEETEEQTPGTGGTEEGTDSSVPEATYNFLVEGEVYAAQTVKDGETLSEPAAPEAEGKTFDGWYTAEIGGEKFTAFGVQTVTETKTVDLYAGWQEAQDSEEEPGTDEGTTLEEETGTAEKTETSENIQSGETNNSADGSVEHPSNGLESANGSISTLEITGTTKTVEVGETITLSGGGGWLSYNHKWKCENQDEGEVSFNRDAGTTAQVTGKKAGTVTIIHTYTEWGRDYRETCDITVTEPLAEGEYKLYIYTLVPGMTDETPAEVDKKWNGMGEGTISGVGSPGDYPNSTIIDNGYGNSGAVIDYASERYPDIEVEGITYQYAADGTPEAMMKGYYTIDWIRVIVSDGANAGKNGYNSVVASGTPTFHLDGVITVNAENLYTVQFKLKDAGGEEFSIVDPVKYSKLVENNYSVRELDRPDANEPSVYIRKRRQ